ncbi:hypothetical protein, partial [Pseudarcicella hirudinis]|uniref:hypothetical protein n=1 Tax=Pseudarcicella hirudinis TaxID=1079859 RepID=UPI00362EB464
LNLSRSRRLGVQRFTSFFYPPNLFTKYLQLFALTTSNSLRNTHLHLEKKLNFFATRTLPTTLPFSTIIFILNFLLFLSPPTLHLPQHQPLSIPNKNT